MQTCTEQSSVLHTPGTATRTTKACRDGGEVSIGEPQMGN